MIKKILEKHFTKLAGPLLILLVVAIFGEDYVTIRKIAFFAFMIIIIGMIVFWLIPDIISDIRHAKKQERLLLELQRAKEEKSETNKT